MYFGSRLTKLDVKAFNCLINSLTVKEVSSIAIKTIKKFFEKSIKIIKILRRPVLKVLGL